MPLLFILRLLFAVLSLAILGASGYLLWDWWRGELVQGDDGLLHRVREDWRLWLALAPLAWSFLGRFIVPLIIARADTDRVEAGARRRHHPRGRQRRDALRGEATGRKTRRP